jgi:hypothetical protein
MRSHSVGGAEEGRCVYALNVVIVAASIVVGTDLVTAACAVLWGR